MRLSSDNSATIDQFFLLESRDLPTGSITSRVSTQTPLACFHEFFSPRVEVVGLDAFKATQFVGCDLAPETLEDYVDLLFCGALPGCR